MRAVITVIGKDTVGILAKVATVCAEHKANVIDVTQTVMQEMFAMIMFADISGIDVEFGVLAKKLQELGTAQALSIHVMHEDIFDTMHKI